MFTGKAALMGAAFIALTACHSNNQGAVTNGTVIGKRYYPPEWEILNGKNHLKPECYRLNLSNKGRIGPVCVAPIVFNNIRVEDRY